MLYEFIELGKKMQKYLGWRMHLDVSDEKRSYSLKFSYKSFIVETFKVGDFQKTHEIVAYDGDYIQLSKKTEHLDLIKKFNLDSIEPRHVNLFAERTKRGESMQVYINKDDNTFSDYARDIYDQKITAIEVKDPLLKYMAASMERIAFPDRKPIYKLAAKAPVAL